MSAEAAVSLFLYLSIYISITVLFRFKYKLQTNENEKQHEHEIVSKIQIELQPQRFPTNGQWSPVGSVTNSPSPTSNTKNIDIDDLRLPDPIIEEKEYQNEDQQPRHLQNQQIEQEQQYEQKSNYNFIQSFHVDILLYFLAQSTNIAAIIEFLLHSQSKYDLHYMLFIVSISNLVFCRIFLSIYIFAATKNSKHLMLQLLDVMAVFAKFNNNIPSKSSFIQRYIQSFQSIYGSSIQLMAGVAFILYHWNDNEFGNIFIWLSIGISSVSMIVFSHCNIQQSESIIVYFCRFLEISSRIIAMILIWIYLGVLFLTIPILTETVYLTICILTSKSRNILFLGNMFYIIIDGNNVKQNKIFIAYRIIFSYLYLVAILLLMQEVIFGIDFDKKYAFDIDSVYCYIMFIFCCVANPMYQIFLLCKLKKNIESIGQCWNLHELITSKCWNEIYELMKLGVNYKYVTQNNSMNLLSQVCMEADCQSVHLQIAKLYLSENDTFENNSNSQSYTWFYTAIQNSSTKMIALLIENGANIEYVFEEHDSMNTLQVAINSTNTSMNKIQFIINAVRQKYSLSEQYNKLSNFLDHQAHSNGDTALLMIHSLDDYEMINRNIDKLNMMEYVIWNGANINIRDRKGNNVLHYAVQKRQWRMVKMIIKNGADINIGNDENKTALHIACKAKCDKLEIIKLLMYGYEHNKKRISYSNISNLDINSPLSKLVNLQDKYGRTVLHYASCNCYSDIIKYLIDRNSDCTIKDNEGLTPLHYAIKYNIDQTMNEGLLSLDVVILLVVVAKSHVNSKSNDNDKSILHDAAQYQSISIMDYLIKNGANPHNTDNNNKLPKYYSIGRYDEYEIMEYWRKIYDDDDDDEMSELSKMNHLETYIHTDHHIET